MNIVLYLILIFIYISHIKNISVYCRKQYDIKKIKNSYSYNIIHDEIRGKFQNDFNNVIYKRRKLLYIQVPKKKEKGINLYNSYIHDKKINDLLNNKKKNKLYYLHINNNEKGIKRRNKNETLQIFLIKKKKLLQQYIYNLKESLLYKYKTTKIITKIFISSSLILVALNIGGIKPEDIALHSKRVIRAFEFYRIITSALFYGDISLYVLTNIYMLYLQSHELEKSLGSSETFSFYLSQITILSVLCSYLKKPFYATALLKSLLFVNCMLKPYQKSNLIFGIHIYNIYLPYLSIFIDILHAQNLKASLSGILGVTSGSIYYLLNVYLYENYNKKFFKIPKFLKNYLDSLSSDELF
ncbi:DER1-like protein [Plasmodium brasilianum]|uniref:Derlin n=2 Tax=Plasmodium (Plasmodium) TaxID=418103 RepID=A0A1A8W9Q6_PLAMA|nr:DER1-like protein, putative [Plasmodium malariae]KAI4836759.1 DER1-like protein [Plasmodium brasilianum]SBS88699.1 degradation in the ER (DER1) like protein, putative [Plasmodium malariae]SCO94050.1 DER1-like protein, putative [Plasmodium malariae]